MTGSAAPEVLSGRPRPDREARRPYRGLAFQRQIHEEKLAAPLYRHDGRGIVKHRTQPATTRRYVAGRSPRPARPSTPADWGLATAQSLLSRRFGQPRCQLLECRRRVALVVVLTNASTGTRIKAGSTANTIAAGARHPKHQPVGGDPQTCQLSLFDVKNTRLWLGTPRSLAWPTARPAVPSLPVE